MNNTQSEEQKKEIRAIWKKIFQTNDIAAAAALIESDKHNVNLKDKFQEVPLHAACGNGLFEIAELLLKNGANPNSKNKWDETPFNQACSKGNIKILRLLFEFGANVLDPSNIIRAINGNSDLEVVKFLIEKGCPLNYVNKLDQSPFLHACFKGRMDIVLYFLKQKEFDVYQKTKNNHNAIYKASQSKNTELIRFLIDNFPEFDINEKTKFGWTPFFTACIRGNLETAKFLYFKGSNPHIVDEDGNTPFICACESMRREIVEFLVSIGVDTYAKNKDGYTGIGIFIKNCCLKASTNQVPFDSSFFDSFLEYLIECAMKIDDIESYLEKDALLDSTLKKDEDISKLWNNCVRNIRNRRRLKEHIAVDSESNDLKTNPAINTKSTGVECFDR